ncbi:NTP transferase domain-containing protein [Novosphingobium sp. 9U]|uniref:nucleotidyltransferase family protein n=1 Tax=Novosphingobium sp. 9U TaxID=2653158 RepID=UPI0012F28608|nr:nucleotidyltransferase family protein [Novosphingobium sp. 9U]VWX46655.1 Molybdopterin-guanine dinucleotide biosynthesis protein MobA [Novosphingobium sp. 9U]
MTRAALVLAAGSARRFGSDKLSAPFRGEPLLFQAIRAARAAPVDRVIVVARPGLDCGTWPGAPATAVVRVTSEALSASLKAGLTAAGEIETLTVFLGDMPLVPPDLAASLAAILDDSYAAMPRQGGKPGHPVVLSRRALADIPGLQGDAGAGKLLRSRDDVVFLDCDDAGIHADVDRPDDLERLAVSS